jgi:hypothetical protein
MVISALSPKTLSLFDHIAVFKFPYEVKSTKVKHDLPPVRYYDEDLIGAIWRGSWGTPHRTDGHIVEYK